MIEKCETCKFSTGENTLICKCEDSDNMNDFVATTMICESWQPND